MKDGITPKMQ